jgi:hypothetical protein
MYVNQSKVIAIALGLTALVAGPNTQPTFTQKLPTGKLQLTAIASSLITIIEGNGVKYEVKSNSEAKYENDGLIEIPVGVYRITSKKGWFHPFHRASFRVWEGVVTKITVSPAIRILMQKLVSDENGIRDEFEYAPEPQYASFEITQVANAPSDLLIRFTEKTERDGFTEYTANKTIGGVMISYDILTIWAPRVRFNGKKLILETEGGVVYENGRQYIHTQNLKVIFQKGEAKVTPY